jgi:type I restriction-modification system DNA methylase subunit
MPLFQKSVISNYLKSQDKNLLSKRWIDYKNHFHNLTIQDNIRKSDEIQYQSQFLTDLMVNIFGYIKNPLPDFNLMPEKTTYSDNTRADGGIIIDSKVKAVIELKGMDTTDLGKIESQAFGYKNKQPDCTYVITSNFEKLRFYIDNSTEFLEFNLFQLTESEFELLHLCLDYDNIAKDIPKILKGESVSRESTITKSLYNDYSLFKRELHQSLVLLNPQYDPLLLFQKSQKLLDRFLFLFFGEDRHLLPPNSVRQIITDWNKLKELNAYTPLYDRFKQYFGYLNTGYKGVKYNVFAYNGGLFKNDDVIDSITIDDNLLYKHTLKLSEYDFASEVDVNILGHIFENSLNELDEIKAQLEGKEIDKSKTKRKKDGVFYTPKYITKYIVENTVGKLCEEQKAALGIIEEEYFTDKKRQKKIIQSLVEKLEIYRKWLLQLTICDPACGSGAFLNQALDFLIEEHQYIDELQAKLFGDAMVLSDMENSILENNLFGVDLNEESVEIAKLSLWLRTAQPNRKLNDLNGNIKCGNSLIDDVEVAGDKAFNWQQAFPKVFERGGFDVIIGNPPYVQVNDNFYNKYSTYKCGDLYAYFFEKGIEINKPNGIFSYITPSLFIKGMRYETLRNFLINNSLIIEILDKGDKVFDAVQMPTAITTLKNIKVEGQIWSNYFNDNKLIDKLNFGTISIGSISKIMRGLEIGKDKVNIGSKSIQFLTGEDVFRYGINSFSHITDEVYKQYKKENLFFEGDRILIRETGSRLTSIFIDDNKTQQNRSLYSIKLLNNKEYDYKFVISILNSKTIQFYYKSKFSANTDIFPKIRIGQVKELPIKVTPIIKQKPFIEKADQLILLNKELQEQSQKFQRTIQRKFELEELPKKLQDWYKLTYTEFIKELSKKKVKLSLSQEAEWEEFFIQESKKALEIKANVDETDKSIDALVYELYGLDDEEIAIVENSSLK